ncbi:MAG: N-acetylmuramoyl-L-alanine amidase [Planctomycetota bacterium]
MPSRHAVVLLLLCSLGCVSNPRRPAEPPLASVPHPDPYEIVIDEVARARLLTDSGSPDAAAALARALEALQGLPQGARRERAAVELFRARGDFLLKHGRLEEAVKDFERALPLASPAIAEEIAARLYLIAETRGDENGVQTYRRLLGSSTHAAIIAARARFGMREPVAKASRPRDDGGAAVLERSEWHARPTRRDQESPMSRITRITVHHSGDSFTDTSRQLAATTIYDIQGIHQNQRDWADIGYHFVIDPAGRVWQGRELSYQGAHAGNPDLNRGNIGICLLGNFDAQSVPAKQRDALLRLIDELRERYHVTRQNIYTHAEMHREGNLAATACPGQNLQRIVDGYRSQLASTAGAAGWSNGTRRTSSK